MPAASFSAALRQQRQGVIVPYGIFTVSRAPLTSKQSASRCENETNAVDVTGINVLQGDRGNAPTTATIDRESASDVPLPVAVAPRSSDPIFYPKTNLVVVAPQVPAAASTALLSRLPEESEYSCGADTDKDITSESPRNSSLALAGGSAENSFDREYDDEFSGWAVVFQDPTPLALFAELPFHYDLDPGKDYTLEPSSCLSPACRSDAGNDRPTMKDENESFPRSSKVPSSKNSYHTGIMPTIRAPSLTRPLSRKSSRKICVPTVQPSISSPQRTTASGDIVIYEPKDPPCPHASVSFVGRRTSADIVLAMSTSMPSVIDLDPQGTRRSAGVVSAGIDGGGADAAKATVTVTAESQDDIGVTSTARSMSLDSTSPQAAQALRRTMMTADTAAFQSAQVSSKARTPDLGAERRNTEVASAEISSCVDVNCTSQTQTPTSADETDMMRNGQGIGVVRHTIRPNRTHREVALSISRSGGSNDPPMPITRVFGP
ncbi:hypothetical protein H0H92_005475 [Tricholoma furcatifolium]|nr:hypothetical protein H0H92_005475 [Tricholoma furcatifolium]